MTRIMPLTSHSQMHPLTYVYINEISPFVHRAKYVTIVQFATRASSAFNSFINPIALKSLAWKYYLVYVAWLVVETLVVFFLYPETKGPTLEELGDLFEKADVTGGKNIDIEGDGSEGIADYGKDGVRFVERPA